MPEAVIVATARSPIGRAGKGSMTSIRPDDLVAQMIQAAFDRIPNLDPMLVEDLYLGASNHTGARWLSGSKFRTPAASSTASGPRPPVLRR